MKYFMVLLIAMRLMGEESATDSLVCEVSGEGSKLVQCSYFCQRDVVDRNITFEWNAPSLSQDNRERTVLLEAHHGSLYDFRYYYGLEPGGWLVRVKEGDKILREVTFKIESEGEEEY